MYGDGSLDIGTQTIAICSNREVKLFELADRVKILKLEAEKHKLLVKMDSSRRCTNADNYNTDGTIKKQGNKKVFWYKSKRYIKLQNRLKELYRRQAGIRKYQYECLANYIVSLGNRVYVEKMSFKELQ